MFLKLIPNTFIFLKTYSYVLCVCAISEATRGGDNIYTVLGVKYINNFMYRFEIKIRPLYIIVASRDVYLSPGAYIAAKHNASLQGPIYFELNKRSTIFEIRGTFLRVRHDNVKKKKIK
jgi:hypothetical protein